MRIVWRPGEDYPSGRNGEQLDTCKATHHLDGSLEWYFSEKAESYSLCPDSPDEEHSFGRDFEYDSSGQTLTCEYCGQWCPDEEEIKV